MGIIVTGGGANKVQFSASNFLGVLHSHVMLAQADSPVSPLAWVREDVSSFVNGSFPTPPGIYYIQIVSSPETAGEVGSFMVDPLLSVSDEVLDVVNGTAQLKNYQQYLAQTLRIYQNRAYLLRNGSDYEVDSRGVITFFFDVIPGSLITADYRYAVDSLGPLPFKWEESDTTTIPGVVLAFSDQTEVGQVAAVVVYSERVEAAEVYGGKTEVTFELEVLARDTTSAAKLADATHMYLWDEFRTAASWEGIEVLDVSQGSEGSDPIDETGQDFQYSVPLTLQLQADWEAHKPIPLTIVRTSMKTTQVASDLFFKTVPVLNRSASFERF